jgi:hypothetical protein
MTCTFPALDAGGQVTGVIAAVVDGEAAFGEFGEHRVVAVDGPHVHRFAQAGGLGHGADRDASVHPAGVVAREQVIGQRGEQEVVGLQHLPSQALGLQRPHVGLQHPADQVAGQGGGVGVVGQPSERVHQFRAEQLGGAHPVQHVRSALGDLKRLGEQLPEVVHPHPPAPERLGEHVVFFLGLGRPHHVVEQQVADVLRGQPGQFQSGPVHDHLPELAYLRLHGQGHVPPPNESGLVRSPRARAYLSRRPYARP